LNSHNLTFYPNDKFQFQFKAQVVSITADTFVYEKVQYQFLTGNTLLPHFPVYKKPLWISEPYILSKTKVKNGLNGSYSILLNDCVKFCFQVSFYFHKA